MPPTMPAYLPDFLRRFGLLRDARRDLLRGEPDRALERLRDPSLVVSRRAAELRERAVDLLCRAADERAAEGRDRSAARLLDLAEGEDPLRAARWRERLGAAAPKRHGEKNGGTNRGAADGDSGDRNGASMSRDSGKESVEAGGGTEGSVDADAEPPAEARRRLALGEVLAEMRASSVNEERAGSGSSGFPGEREERGEGSPSSAPSSESEAVDGNSGGVVRIHLGIDLVGDLLLCVGQRWTLGHQRAGLADLPFLADVPPVGASIQFGGMSFHGGPSWTLVEGLGVQSTGARAGGGAEVVGPGLSDSGLSDSGPPDPGCSDPACSDRGGSDPDSGERGSTATPPRALRDGEILDLAPNLRLRFRCPDPEVSMALLELLDDSECLGAQRILLLAPGPKSTIRIGPSGSLRAPIPSGDVEMVLEGGEIRFRAPANLRLIGDDLDPGALEPSPEQRAPFPPRGRLDLLVGQGDSGRPPFGICLRPVEELS